MKLPTLSVLHVAAVSAVLSIGMMWLYMKVQRMENRIQQLSHMMAWAATNQDTASYLADIGAVCPQQGGGETAEVEEAQVETKPTIHVEDNTDAMSIRSDDFKAVMEHIQNHSGTVTPMDEGSLTPTGVSIVAPVSPSSMTHVVVDEESPRNFKNKTVDELKSFSVEELRSYLKDHNHSTKGNKADLIQRIVG